MNTREKTKELGMNNAFYFEIMPKILAAIQESLDHIAKHSLKKPGARYAESFIYIDGVHDRVRYDRFTDKLCVVICVSEDENHIALGFGSGCLADFDKIKHIEIPLPSFLIHNHIAGK